VKTHARTGAFRRTHDLVFILNIGELGVSLSHMRNVKVIGVGAEAQIEGWTNPIPLSFD